MLSFSPPYSDSVNRAIRKADGSREQLQQLKAENEALKVLLLDLAQPEKGLNTRTKARLEVLLATSLASGEPLTVSKLLKAAAEPDEVPMEEIGVTTSQVESPVIEEKVLRNVLPLPPVPTPPTQEQLPKLAQSAVKSLESFFMPMEETRVSSSQLESPMIQEEVLRSVIPLPPAVPNPPTQEQLSKLAQSAIKSSKSFFVFPPEPVPVRGPVYIYYNKRSGPLKRCGAGPLMIQCGTNKWETVDALQMASAAKDLPVR